MVNPIIESMEDILINTSILKASKEYVCWIDTMGTKNTMSDSFEKAANFMIRFHSIVIESLKDADEVRFYPVMDGIYLTSLKWESIRKVISRIFTSCAEVFINEEIIAHRFVIRGAIAFGQVSHGTDITENVCKNIFDHEKYKNTLLMGMPMIQAFTSENCAPPFGLYIHESARQVKVLQGRYYGWLNDSKLKEDLRLKIKQYFEWCYKYKNYLCMSQEKLKIYLELNEEHLTNMKCKESDFESPFKIV